MNPPALEYPNYQTSFCLSVYKKCLPSGYLLKNTEVTNYLYRVCHQVLLINIGLVLLLFNEKCRNLATREI